MKRLALPALALLAISCHSKTTEPDSAPAAPSATASAEPPAPPPDLSPPSDWDKPPVDAKTTPSGIKYLVLASPNEVASPTPGSWDIVRVRYGAWNHAGKYFEGSLRANHEVTLKLGGTTPGLREALTTMRVGERRRLWVPAALGYSQAPDASAGSHPLIGPPGDLIYEVELFGIQHVPPPPSAPTDLAAPPRDAKRMASGLAYRVLASGSPTAVRPAPNDRVAIWYQGWTKDGKLFDTTNGRDRPMVIALRSSMEGMKRALVLMKPGDKFRVWIPAELAYGNEPANKHLPAGPLVYDLELVEIVH